MEPSYDRNARLFESHAATSSWNAHLDRPAVLALLGEVAGRRVLDAGCGPGLYADALLAAGAEVTGFDASEQMVELARARLGDRADVHRAVLGEPLPFDDGAFDAAVCALVIHHVDDRPAAYRELHRVLRPGGALVVSTTHPMHDWQRVGTRYFEAERIEETWDGWGTVRYWRLPLSLLCDEVLGAGFVIDGVAEPRPTPALRDLDPDEFGELSHEPAILAMRLRKPT